MTYVSYSEGFKSGGFNQRYNAAPPGQRAHLLRRGNRRDRARLGIKLNPLPGTAHQRRAVHHQLRRHPDDLPPGRRAAAVQCRQGIHRWWRTGGRLVAHQPPAASMPAPATWIRASTASRRRRPSAACHRPPRRHLSSRLPFTPELDHPRRGCRMRSRCSNGWTLTPRVDISYTGLAVLRCRQLGGGRADRWRHALERVGDRWNRLTPNGGSRSTGRTWATSCIRLRARRR